MKLLKLISLNGVEMKKKSDEIIANMNSIEGKRTLSQKKSQLQLKASAINVELANLRNEGTEKKNLLKEITKNKEAIDKNAQIDAQLNVINANIKNEENIKRGMMFVIDRLNGDGLLLAMQQLIKIAADPKYCLSTNSHTLSNAKEDKECQENEP